MQVSDNTTYYAVTILLQSLQSDVIFDNQPSAKHFMEVNGRCTYLNNYGVAPKNSNTATLARESHTGFSIPAVVPRHTFPLLREPRNISFHPRGIPADSTGFPWSPSLCATGGTTTKLEQSVSASGQDLGIQRRCNKCSPKWLLYIEFDVSHYLQTTDKAVVPC